MKLIIALAALILTGASPLKTEKKPSLNGIWCVGDEGFILKFSGNDSIHVTSTTDESIKANGIYQKSDTTFTATVINGDVTMKLKYQYHWNGTDSIKAKAEQFTINDESVNSPEEWMFMTRCLEEK